MNNAKASGSDEMEDMRCSCRSESENCREICGRRTALASLRCWFESTAVSLSAARDSLRCEGLLVMLLKRDLLSSGCFHLLILNFKKLLKRHWRILVTYQRHFGLEPLVSQQL